VDTQKRARAFRPGLAFPGTPPETFYGTTLSCRSVDGIFTFIYFYQEVRKMKRWVFVVIGLGLFLLFSRAGFAQNPNAVLGKWWNEEKDAHIEIYSCEGRICGKIIWLKEPNYPADDAKGMAGKSKVDRENSDTAKRELPILGMNLVWGFTHAGENVWEGGSIYNPREGKTYKCKMTLENQDTLKVRGFIGISLIGKTNIWTRFK
jgi:uncharacterized protein (DUF2147 family)